MNSDGLCGGMYQAVHSQIVICHHDGEIQWGKEPGSHSGICPEGVVHLDVKRKAKENRSFFRTGTKIVEMTSKGFSGIDNFRIYLEVISIANNCVWGHREGERLELDVFNVGTCFGFMYRGIYHYMTLLLSGVGLSGRVSATLCRAAVRTRLTSLLIVW